MKATAANRHTSLGHGLLVLGDLWNLLLVRGLLTAGPGRFLDLKQRLGISDPVLVRRLRDLADDGLVRAGERAEYTATEAALAAWPAFVALHAWDRRWAPGSPLRLRTPLVHDACGHRTDPVFGCGACGAIGLSARDTTAEVDPDVPFAATNPRRRYHRSASAGPAAGDADPAGPVASAAVLADRTSTALLAAAFLGHRRFGDFQTALHDTAPHTLTSRLALLTEQGILAKEPLRAGGRRHGYRLTPKGHDFFPTFACLIAWSGAWFTSDGRAGVRITHRACGAELVPRWTCNACNAPLTRAALSGSA
ncbi:winged helix-turn-helix transcriptional regulator [Yinghuangia seranimata]|uniref:winged helix-turn-helix transcriptional regulator n=1 Tax=Yinghuangia seranimata TaxID=408067 RepID=UPI00248B5556|nr:helix-turn-helix domain-containing protein [Yinghuangia seranimata]MDI2125885.1 helix-turn-helix domain-containing protein [Yinghuangia seranimata]